MRHLAAIPLLICFLGLGSGAVGYLHTLDHQRQDTSLAKAPGQTPTQRPQHDDSNCQIHAQLHMPMIALGWVPLLVCLGLFVAFLTLLSPALTPQRTPAAFHCRGPPSC